MCYAFHQWLLEHTTMALKKRDNESLKVHVHAQQAGPLQPE